MNVIVPMPVKSRAPPLQDLASCLPFEDDMLWNPAHFEAKTLAEPGRASATRPLAEPVPHGRFAAYPFFILAAGKRSTLSAGHLPPSIGTNSSFSESSTTWRMRLRFQV